MRPIFFSYRKQGEDNVRTEQLAGALRTAFGEEAVFRDDEGLTFGKFAIQLRNHAQECKALIAVVGPVWIERIPDLHNPFDWVRREIEAALLNNALILPLYLGEVTPPNPADLPESLAGLLEYQSKRMHKEHWDRDVKIVRDGLSKQLNLRILPTVPEIPDLTGKWRGTEGETVTIVHRGDHIRLAIANSFGFALGEGSGNIRHGELEFDLHRRDFGNGRGRAAVAPSGRQISGEVMYSGRHFGFSLSRL